jgi:hypothetical protein
VGFFKKIFKGVKKVFKKIGKAIKGVFKKVGKFMGKIGIIGQIGLALVLPGIGQMLSAGLVGATGTGGLAGALSGLGTVGKAAAGFIKGAVNIASRTSNFFSSITDGVTKVLGETVGAAAKSLGVTPESFIGKGLGKVGIDVGSASWEGVWTKTQTAFTDAVNKGANIFTGKLDAQAAEALATSATTQVQEGLQAKLDPTIGQPKVSTAAFDTAAEKLRQETLQTTFSSESLLSQAPAPVQAAAPITTGVPDYVAKTFGEKVTDFGKEAFELGRGKAMEAVSDLPSQAVQAAGTTALTKLGLVQEPEYISNVNYASVPALDMGSTTDIGYGLTTPSLQTYYDTYGANYINSNPYGQVAQLYDVYGAAIKARGFG